MKKILLASGSPRRRSLLQNYGFDITVVKPAFDEENIKISDPEKLVCELARGKNSCVFADDGTLVLSADTVVALNGKILGKPKTPEQAYNMLSSLSGNTHTVYTGVCLRKGNIRKVFCSKSSVSFHKLSEHQINSYIASGSPFDKAGGYGIQDDMGIAFVDSVDGEISNVIGLPMGAVIREINKIEGENK